MAKRILFQGDSITDCGRPREVKNSDFFKIGIPFTFAAIVPAYFYLWIMYGV